MSQTKMDEIRQNCSGCTRCVLSEGRTNLVFGVGNPDAEVLLIGEGPGEQEDLQGIPFVGPAGKLLDTMLELIDLDTCCYTNDDIGRREVRINLGFFFHREGRRK